MLNILKKTYSYLYFQSWRIGLWTPKDRVILRKKIFKHLSENSRYKRILFVGVQDYCSDYKNDFKDKDFYTIDPQPEVKKYGSNNHIVDYIQNIERHFLEGSKFDAIVFNGVIGYGLNEHSEAEKSIAACKKMLRSDGLFIVGVNPENTANVSYDKLESLQGLNPWVLPDLGVSSLNVSFPLHKNLSHSYYFYSQPSEPTC